MYIPPQEVVVLEEGHYNGPDNRSLGFCEYGDIIVIGGGHNLDWLLEHQMVELLEVFLEKHPVSDEELDTFDNDLSELDSLLDEAHTQDVVDEDVAEIAEPVASTPAPKRPAKRAAK